MSEVGVCPATELRSQAERRELPSFSLAGRLAGGRRGESHPPASTSPAREPSSQPRRPGLLPETGAHVLKGKVWVLGSGWWGVRGEQQLEDIFCGKLCSA